jgi:nucleoside-diphosphate-sugar epimerase
MKVFVTGATGFVGSAVVTELLGAGHEVVGLARSDAGAEALNTAGAKAHRGDLEDLDSLEKGAAEADGVLHLGFIHDFKRYAQCCAVDERAIQALGRGLEGTDKPLIVTSGLVLASQSAEPTEADNPPPDFMRKSEAAAKALAERGVRASVVRLPPSTHGAGDAGFVPMLIDIARKTGSSAYIGDGSNRWSATHRNDAARVFRLALERDAEGGPIHAVAEESIAFKDIADAIGRGLGVPVVSKSKDEAAAHFDWFALFAGMTLAASSARTRKLLDWTPAGPGLIADMEKAGYFYAK